MFAIAKPLDDNQVNTQLACKKEVTLSILMSTSDLLLVSIVYNSLLLALAGWWLFNLDRTPYDKCCTVFFLPILALIAVSISRRNLERKRAIIPLSVNLTTLILIIFIAVFRSNWDLDFILHGKEFSSALQVVNVDEIVFSEADGVRIKLPQQYKHLARFGEIYITQDKGDETILVVFPDTPDDLDGIMTAYIYVVGKNVSRVPKKCLSGRPVNPRYENWYYCVVAGNHVR